MRNIYHFSAEFNLDFIFIITWENLLDGCRKLPSDLQDIGEFKAITSVDAYHSRLWPWPSSSEDYEYHSKVTCQSVVLLAACPASLIFQKKDSGSCNLKLVFVFYLKKIKINIYNWNQNKTQCYTSALKHRCEDKERHDLKRFRLVCQPLREWASGPDKHVDQHHLAASLVSYCRLSLRSPKEMRTLQRLERVHVGLQCPASPEDPQCFSKEGLPGHCSTNNLAASSARLSRNRHFK